MEVQQNMESNCDNAVGGFSFILILHMKAMNITSDNSGQTNR